MQQIYYKKQQIWGYGSQKFSKFVPLNIIIQLLMKLYCLLFDSFYKFASEIYLEKDICKTICLLSRKLFISSGINFQRKVKKNRKDLHKIISKEMFLFLFIVADVFKTILDFLKYPIDLIII